LITYEKYLKDATEKGFEIMPKKDWIGLKNQIIKDRIFLRKMNEIDNQRVDNLLKRIENERKHFNGQ